MKKYTGVREIILNDKDIETLKGRRTIPSDQFKIDEPYILNEYIAIKDERGQYTSYKYRYDGEKLTKLKYEKIDNTYVDEIEPRNVKQEMLFDLLQNDEIPVKLVTGSMGGGKTFVTTNTALHKIQHQKNIYKKIVYIRNNIEVKDTQQLGALPNGLKEKLLPFILPIQDCLGGNPMQLEHMERAGTIEYVHLGHVRGRSFSNAVIIVSEAENLTKDHVKLLVGRVGENSVIIFEGDLSQTDKKVFEKESGIESLREILGGNPLFGAVQLDKSERSAVAELSNLF